MLKNGFYSTKVSGPFGSSSGVLLLSDSRFNGGDDYMIYQGEISQDSSVSVSALVYRDKDVNTGKRFSLAAKVQAEGDGFVARGRYPNGGDFQLEAKFVSAPVL